MSLPDRTHQRERGEAPPFECAEFLELVDRDHDTAVQSLTDVLRELQPPAHHVGRRLLFGKTIELVAHVEVGKVDKCQT